MKLSRKILEKRLPVRRGPGLGGCTICGPCAALVSPDIAGNCLTWLAGSTYRAFGPAASIWAPDEASLKVRNIGLGATSIEDVRFATHNV